MWISLQVKCRVRNFSFELDNFLCELASVLERISRTTFPTIITVIVVTFFIPWWPWPGGPDMLTVFESSCLEDDSWVLLAQNSVISQGWQEALDDVLIYGENTLVPVILLIFVRRFENSKISGADLRGESQAGLTEPQNHIVWISTRVAFNAKFKECVDT
jgi:hypothetical protein